MVVGWLWYAGTLVPVIGIVLVGGNSISDRLHIYPPHRVVRHCGMGIPELLNKWRYRQRGPCCVVCFDSFRLFHSDMDTGRGTGRIASRCLAVPWKLPAPAALSKRSWAPPMLNKATTSRLSRILTGPSRLILNIRRPTTAGVSLMVRLATTGRRWRIFDRAIEIYPKYLDAYINRGAAHGRLGNYQEGLKILTMRSKSILKKLRCISTGALPMPNSATTGRQFWITTVAIDINPTYAEAYYDRGVFLW